MMGVNRLALYRKYKESMQQWVKIAHSHQELKEALEILNLKKIYIRYPSEERPTRCSSGPNETKQGLLNSLDCHMGYWASDREARAKIPSTHTTHP